MRRSRFAHYAAPIAFLAAVTIIVLIVHSALQGTHPATKPTTTTQTTTTRSHHHHRTTHRHARTYTVQSGDTLESIAQKTGTTVTRLEQLNPKVDPTALQVGETIRVR